MYDILKKQYLIVFDIPNRIDKNGCISLNSKGLHLCVGLPIFYL